MPELPEVQTIVDDLCRAGIVGTRILAAETLWCRSIAVPSADEFRARIAGQTIRACRRRAKFIVFDLERGRHILVHLRMSGRLHLEAATTPREPHERVVFVLDTGRELRLHDTRKFARVYLVDDAATILGGLGPEPLEQSFTAQDLASRLAHRRRRLKPLLLDQTFLAGLGNIYVDEALWEARLHPGLNAATLTPAQVKTLFRAIRTVLARGLQNRGTSLGQGESNFHSLDRERGGNASALRVFRRTGLPCPRCRTSIERFLVGQRATHVCPRCQPVF
jgi:formamidopyrimidine-DNA glycosylase